MNDINLSPYVIAGLKNMGDMPKRYIDIKPEDYFIAGCKHFKVSVEDVVAKSRKDDIVYARHIIVHLIARNTNISLKKIVDMFSPAFTHHTTAMHCRDYIQDQISINNLKVINDLEIVSEMAKLIGTIKYN